MSNNPLSTYRALYNMALINGHQEAIIFFKNRIDEAIVKQKVRECLVAKRRYRTAVCIEKMQHHGAMMRLGFTLKNGQYYASR